MAKLEDFNHQVIGQNYFVRIERQGKKQRSQASAFQKSPKAASVTRAREAPAQGLPDTKGRFKFIKNFSVRLKNMFLQ